MLYKNQLGLKPSLSSLLAKSVIELHTLFFNIVETEDWFKSLENQFNNKIKAKGD